MKRISRNALWLFLARASSQGLMLIFTVLIARHLGETGLGQYAFIAAVVVVGNVFSTSEKLSATFKINYPAANWLCELIPNRQT